MDLPTIFSSCQNDSWTKSCILITGNHVMNGWQHSKKPVRQIH
jgi:hypothetical protein